GQSAPLRRVLALHTAALIFPPLQKFAKQRLPLFLRQICRCGPSVFQEGRKIAASHLRVGLLGTNTPQHLFRDSPASPAWDRGGEIDVAPLRVTRRLTELVPVREEPFDEPFNAPIAIVAFLPIEDRQHGRNRESID